MSKKNYIVTKRYLHYDEDKEESELIGETSKEFMSWGRADDCFVSIYHDIFRECMPDGYISDMGKCREERLAYGEIGNTVIEVELNRLH